VSGTQTSSLNGSITTSTIKGTLTVNADCTGTLTVSVYDQSNTLLSTEARTAVFVDDATEMQAVMTSLVLPDNTSVPTVISLNAKELSLGRS
jgi:hypothetical protein